MRVYEVYLDVVQQELLLGVQRGAVGTLEHRHLVAADVLIKV